MMSSPCSVTRRPAIRISRLRTSSGNDGECLMSKRSRTALETLLTFCPPGPEARMKLNSSSFSSRSMRLSMRIMMAV